MDELAGEVLEDIVYQCCKSSIHIEPLVTDMLSYWLERSESSQLCFETLEHDCNLL